MLETITKTVQRDMAGATPKARRTMQMAGHASDALYLAQAAKLSRSEGARLVLLCENAMDAFRLKEEMQYFEPSLSIEYFPDWETLPYDLLSPHQDLVSDRLEILNRLVHGQSLDVLLVTPTTAAQRIAPPA
jgi:transcription-repair coupling factor (superfamily II helicase)